MIRLWIKLIKLTFLSTEIEELIKGNTCTQVQPTQSSIPLRNERMENNYIFFLFGTRNLNVLLLNGFEQKTQLAIDFETFACHLLCTGEALSIYSFICSFVHFLWRSVQREEKSALNNWRTKERTKRKACMWLKNEGELSNTRLDWFH